MDEPIEMLFGLRTQVGPRTTYLMGFTSPMGMGNFEGRGQPIVKYRDIAVICAKTIKPIMMSFGLSDWTGPRNNG